eukprot:gnl/TRDRNA2_/TRDRNA2_39478_c0_seq1.p1 gnl/TRDRNA2_/TRDRNA2_39478_c0~~gnl/TRDRNA2_/TRDRNA2_39478_c0_seq1.p1  ORF type:complete len:820 (+),score=112.90 gnl/TRDRNA2_/TRDRNA2_39478_c0_seq1:79-2538(+)
MMNRAADPIFASSKSVRRFSNEPRKLTLARIGGYQPPSMREVVDTIFKTYQRLEWENCSAQGVLGSENYSNHVVPEAQRLKAIAYPHLSTDQLEAMRIHTLEEPSFYKLSAPDLYKYKPGDRSVGPWDDFYCHLLQGLALHAKERPRQGRLFRVALIPEDVFNSHFKIGNEVFFAAPMSAAVDPQWSFALAANPQQLAGKVAVLLEFDEHACLHAACLSEAQHPISAFGTGEQEWTFPPFLRGVVQSMEAKCENWNGIPIRTGSGCEVPHVVIAGQHAVPPLSGLLLNRIPSSAVLDAAMLVGMLSSRAGSDTASHCSPVLLCVEKITDSMNKALRYRDTSGNGLIYFSGDVRKDVDEAHVTYGTVAGNVAGWSAFAFALACGPPSAPFAVAFGCNALGYGVGYGVGYALKPSEEQIADEMARKVMERADQLRLKAIAGLDNLHAKSESAMKRRKRFEEQLKDLMANDVKKPISTYMQTAWGYLSGDATGDGQADAFARTLLYNKVIGDILDATHPATEMFASPFPFNDKPAPLETFLGLGAELWSDDTPTCSEAATRAHALMDTLRIMLSTTRMISVMGSPDAGKSTFLEKTFGIATLGSGVHDAARTKQVSLFQHPEFNEELRPVYIADIPGYGDSVEERNEIVLFFRTALASLGPAAKTMWIHRAGNNEVRASDELFQAVSGSLSLVVVTHVDSRLAEMVESTYDALEKDKFDFEADDADKKLRDIERDIMKAVKSEALENIERIRDRTFPCPPIVWASLSPNSWLYSGPPGRRRPRKPPADLITEVADIKKFFDLKDAAALRTQLDDMLGIAVPL